MEGDSQGFSIREYSRKRRSVELRKSWPFSGEITVDLIQSLLPPITVVKFRWWSHELASLLAKPPLTVDDSDSSFWGKANAESRPCKKRSPEIQLVREEDEGDDSYVLIGSKRKRTNDFKFANKVHRCREQARENVDGGDDKSCSGVTSLSSKKDGSFSKEKDSEFKVPGILEANDEVYALQGERRVRFSDQSGNVASLELCCVEMDRLSLFSSEDQSSVNDKRTKVMWSDQNSAAMPFESKLAVSERQLSHARARSELLCFSEPRLSSLDRLKDALDLERKEHATQPVQSFSSASSETTRRSCSTFSLPASADMHKGTLLCQSPLDPVLGEAILRFPLNLQGELDETNGQDSISFDRLGSGTGSSQSNDILLGLDFYSGKKHSTEAALIEDGVDKFPMHNEKHHKYFPTRLGVDETFMEKAYPECGQTVYSPVSEFKPRSHTINLSQHNGLTQNPNVRNVVANRNGLCLHNSQATMRLMGKDVSVGTRYSDMVRKDQRIIAPDASVNSSFLNNHSWLWRRPTVGFSESHSTIALDKNWNRSDTSKDPFPLICEPHVSLVPRSRTTVISDSVFPPTILNPCCSLTSLPMSNMDLSFHGSGLGQANCFPFSQQQLPLPFIPQFAALPCDYNSIGIGPSFGLPLSYTDPIRQSHPRRPESSFGSSRSGLSSINLEEQQLVSHASKPASYINVGTTNKQVGSIYSTVKTHKIPKFPMQF